MKSQEFWWGIAVITFIVLTLPSYIAHSLGGVRISDDARQYTWPFWTFVDATQYPPDFFSQYMLAQTPWGFRWFVRSLVAVGCNPDIIFAAFGVAAFLVCASLAFLTGRVIGGAKVGWAALLLAFAIAGIASTTAGGFPRAAGLAVLSLAVFGFVAGRSCATAAASILGALLWYPAAVVSGSLYALQKLAPKPVFEGRGTQSLHLHLAFVTLVGVLTLLPMLPALSSAEYGELIAASDPSWPEAGSGGRSAEDDMLGIAHPGTVAFGTAVTILNNPEGAWLPSTPFWRHVARVASFSGLIVTWLVLGRLSANDLAARRLIAVFFVGGVLFVLAILTAPYMYVPGRYLRCLWLPAAVVATPYAVYRCRDALPMFAPWLPSSSVLLIVALVGLILFGAGRLRTQGLTVQPDSAETGLLKFAAQTAPGSLFAGWPTGAIEDVPYFSHRPAFLTRELHLPYHVKVARETRARAYSLIDAWFSHAPTGILSLKTLYRVEYFIVDKRLLEAPNYFKPFDARIRVVRQLQSSARPYVAQPDKDIIVFENCEYIVLSLRKLADKYTRLPR